MKFYFCETCGVRLTEKDIDAGAARNKKLKGVYCRECAIGVTTMESLPLKDDEARSVLAEEAARRQEPASPRSRSSRRLPVTSSRSMPAVRPQKQGLGFAIVGGVGAGVMVFLVALFLFLSGPDNQESVDGRKSTAAITRSDASERTGDEPPVSRANEKRPLASEQGETGGMSEDANTPKALARESRKHPQTEAKGHTGGTRASAAKITVGNDGSFTAVFQKGSGYEAARDDAGGRAIRLRVDTGKWTSSATHIRFGELGASIRGQGIEVMEARLELWYFDEFWSRIIYHVAASRGAAGAEIQGEPDGIFKLKGDKFPPKEKTPRPSWVSLPLKTDLIEAWIADDASNKGLILHVDKMNRGRDGKLMDLKIADNVTSNLCPVFQSCTGRPDRRPRLVVRYRIKGNAPPIDRNVVAEGQPKANGSAGDEAKANSEAIQRDKPTSDATNAADTTGKRTVETKKPTEPVAAKTQPATRTPEKKIQSTHPATTEGIKILYFADFEGEKHHFTGSTLHRDIHGRSGQVLRAHNPKDKGTRFIAHRLPVVLRKGPPIYVSFDYYIDKTVPMMLHFFAPNPQGDWKRFLDRHMRDSLKPGEWRTVVHDLSKSRLKLPMDEIRRPRFSFGPLGGHSRHVNLYIDNLCISQGGIPVDVRGQIEAERARQQEVTRSPEKDGFFLSPEVVEALTSRPPGGRPRTLQPAGGYPATEVAFLGSSFAKALDGVSVRKLAGNRTAGRTHTAERTSKAVAALRNAPTKPELVCVVPSVADFNSMQFEDRSLEAYAEALRAARAWGGIPVLFTYAVPQAREGQLKKLVEGANEKLLALAASEKVPCVDAYRILNAPGKRHFSGARLNLSGFNVLNQTTAALYQLLVKRVLKRGGEEKTP